MLTPRSIYSVMSRNGDNPLLNLMKNPIGMHHFFIHSCAEFPPENFCGYYLISVYKLGPRKRMADFLIDNYIKTEDAQNDQYGMFTQSLNLTSQFRDTQTIIQEKKATYADKSRSFSEKKEKHGFLSAIEMKVKGTAKPRVDLFDDLIKQVEINLADTYERFRKKRLIQAPDAAKLTLARFKEAITVAGWHPRLLGIW